MDKIRVILADDHSVLRKGLKLLLNNEPDFIVVGEAANGEEVLGLLEKIAADVLVLDLSMPTMGGLECIKEIRSNGVNISILVLSMHEDEQYIIEAIRAGALGYMEKHAVDTELFTALKAVAKGQRYLSPSNAQIVINSLLSAQPETVATDPYRLLSLREREVLKLLVRGHSMGEIADMLCLSVKTIDTYKTRLMEKLSITKRSQLVEYALQYGLLPSKKGV